jgi:hypothetical protein
MVTLPNTTSFECSINEEILDYNGKNFLADGCVHMPEKKNLKKCITKIEKLTACHKQET